MKLSLKHFLFTFILMVLMAVNSECQTYEDNKTVSYLSGPEFFYYGAEMNGVITGFGETAISQILVDGKKRTMVGESIVFKQTVLGGLVETEIDYKFYIDPLTGNFTFCDNNITQANVKLGSTITIDGNVAHYTSKLDGSSKEIPLTDDIVLGNTHFFPHLINDFVNKKNIKKTYKDLDVLRGEVYEKTFTHIGNETLEFAGKEYHTIVLKELNLKTGASTKMWLDMEKGYPVKMVLAGRITISLADKSVKKQIQSVNFDEVLFGKVNKVIGDFKSISYMEVQGTIRSTGEWLTAETLSVPGQTFTGTVKENLINGVFIIEHKKYDGVGAPAFPSDFSDNKQLIKYLEPEDYIESNDPLLIKKAKEITEGSADSWEASVRISKWVSENITGAIPGGVTARKTFDTRGAECSGHSRLVTALCRGVGIPARMVICCMYSTYYGGSFGQHAWNEVFMGEAGWIPIDATIFEIDYVDCGHIRLGEKTSFNPVEMEILNYKVDDKSMEETERIPSEVQKRFNKYLGNYTFPETGKVFKVLVQGENLAVDIPDKMVLVLNEPDEKNMWHAKLSPMVYFSFKENSDGIVTEMEFHQVIPMSKKSEPDSIDKEIPLRFRSYLGKYFLAQVQAEFEVSYRNGSLAVYDPFEKIFVGLQLPDEKGRWVDEFNKNAIAFEKNDEGKVTAMKIIEEFSIIKGDPAVPIIKNAILTHGIDAGISQYYELKKEPTGKYFLSEASMNTLGYELLGENKIREAIEIFKLNVEVYSESWNVYDSLGEAYMKNDEKEPAIKNYRKSLELNPKNDNGKKMLEKLGIHE